MTGKRVAVAALVAGAGFAPVWPWMWERWTEPGGYFDHGPAVLPVAAAWTWWLVRRGRVRTGPTIWPAWLLVVAGALGLALLASRAVGFVGAMGWWCALGGLLGVTLGTRGLRSLAGPWLFLLFLIPWPLILVEEVSLPLKRVATRVGVALAGEGAVQRVEGARLLLADGGTLLVGDVCSGLRGLIAHLAIGWLLGWWLLAGAWRRGALLLAAATAAVVANAGRIAVLARIGASRGADQVGPGTAIHDLSGLAVHAIAFAMVGSATILLGRKRIVSPPKVELAPLPRISWTLVATAVIGLGWLPALRPERPPSARSQSLSAAIPKDLKPSIESGYPALNGVDEGLDERAAGLLRADAFLSRVFGAPEFCHLMIVQGGGRRTRLHAPEVCFRGNAYDIEATRTLPFPDRFAEAPSDLCEFLSRRGTESRLTWYWYRSGGVSTASYAEFAMRAVLHPDRDQLLLWVSSPVGSSGTDAARLRLRWTLRELATSLSDVLRGA